MTSSNNNFIDDSNNLLGYSSSDANNGHSMENLSFSHSSFQEFESSSNSSNVAGSLFGGQMHLFPGNEYDRSQSAPPYSYSEKMPGASDLSKDDPSAIFGLSHQHQQLQQDPNNQFFFTSNNNFSNNNALEPEWMQQHQQNFSSNGFFFSSGPNVMSSGPFVDQHLQSSSTVGYSNSPPLKSNSMTVRKSRPLIGAAEMTPRADGAKNFSMLEKMIPLDPTMRYTKSQKIEMAASYLTELSDYYESLVRELDNLKDQNKALNW